MSTQSTNPSARENELRSVSMGLLVGIGILGFSVFIVTIADVGIGPPLESAPMFVWNTTAAAVALVFTIQRHRYAHATSVLTGLLVIVTLATIASTGGIDPRSGPLGPLTYLGLALAVIGVALASWRRARTEMPDSRGDRTVT